MLYAFGRFVFMLGIGVAFMSYLVTAMLFAMGVPPPEPLAQASGLIQGLQGLKLSAVMNIATKVFMGLGLFAGYIFTLFRGKQINFDVGKVLGLAAYIGLYTVAADGLTIAVGSILPLWASTVPPLSGVVNAFVTAFYFVSLVALGYYLLVRVFGVPAE